MTEEEEIDKEVREYIRDTLRARIRTGLLGRDDTILVVWTILKLVDAIKEKNNE